MTAVSRRTVVASGAAIAAAAAVPLVRPGQAAARTPRSAYAIGQPSYAGKRVKGQAVSASAAILDAAGHQVGTLRANGVQADTGGSGNLTTQVLQLGQDTVVGVGVGEPLTLAGVYAVVGGTGAHTGARGSYTIQDGALRLNLVEI